MTSEYKETKRDYKAAATQLEETQRAFKNLVDLDPRVKLLATETEQIADVEKKVRSNLTTNRHQFYSCFDKCYHRLKT